MNQQLAKWINQPSQDEGRANWYRRVFSLEQVPAAAQLYFCAPGFYELYVNGKPVEENRVLSPAPSSYDKHVGYSLYEIVHLLQKGKNIINALLGNGYYNCWEEDLWKLHCAPFRDQPKLFCYLLCDRQLVLSSDESWKTKPSGVVYNSLRRGEFFDANQEPEDVFQSEADEAGWKPALYCNPPGGKLQPEINHPCKIQKKLDPVKETSLGFGRTVYDFGVCIAGWCEISLSAPPGTSVFLEYGEISRDNGDLDREYNQAQTKTPVFEEDRFTLGPSGKLSQAHIRFSWRGFRYVRVRAEHPQARIEKIQACVIHNDFKNIGDYQSSEAILNSLLAMTRRSYESNFVGIPTDCPHREKNGWTGDAQLACASGLFLYDSARDYAHFLQCLADTQRANGQLSGIAPSGNWGYNLGSGPAWDMALFVLPYEIHRFSGERQYIEQYYDNMRLYLEFCALMARDGLLYNGLGDWCSVEPFRMTPVEVTSTGCYYDMLQKMAGFSALLGLIEEESSYRAKAAELRCAFNAAFYAGEGRYADDSWTALGTALYFGLAEESEAALTAKRLRDKVRKNACRADFGILGAKYVPHALANAGYIDTALKLFTQTEYPGWGHWVKLGASNLWETWNGINSRNHIMFGDLPNWCFEHLGGMRFENGRLGIMPKIPKSLDSFKCSRLIPGKGVVALQWQKKADGAASYCLELPKELSCKVKLPGREEEILQGPQRFHWN
ncbi:MAG: family 78 glycoside hydrolase catalytic domain [Lentisphaeria bacterium]